MICVGIDMGREMGLVGDRCWRWVEREQQIRKWGEKERGHAYIVVVERNKKEMRRMNILLKYLVK